LHETLTYGAEEVADPKEQSLQSVGGPHGHINKEKDDGPEDRTAPDSQDPHRGGRWRPGRLLLTDSLPYPDPYYFVDI
jgi:hypothetical protein